jgi:hypothetical protein
MGMPGAEIFVTRLFAPSGVMAMTGPATAAGIVLVYSLIVEGDAD